MKAGLTIALGLLALASPALAQQVAPRERWDGRPADRRDLAPRLLAVHNAERRAVGAAPLRWNARLAAHAGGWARELARTSTFRHSTTASRPGEGENLFTGTAGAYSYEDMIGLFIGERVDFRPGVFPDVARRGGWERVGHYTQLIWSTTTEVGCAIATGRGQDYLVCRYSPPGNVKGQRVP
jgi:hypothetical protein